MRQATAGEADLRQPAREPDRLCGQEVAEGGADGRGAEASHDAGDGVQYGEEPGALLLVAASSNCPSSSAGSRR
jgi:hypothetical protein